MTLNPSVKSERSKCLQDNLVSARSGKDQNEERDLRCPTRWERLEYELLMLLPRAFIWERLQIPVTISLHLELTVKKHSML